MSAESCPVDISDKDVRDSVEQAGDYDMSDFDDFYAEPLEDGAVAATSYQPEKLERIDPSDIEELSYDDEELMKYDDFTVIGGDLYGITGEIDFIANENIYGCLDDEVLGMVNDHEFRHSKQFKNIWGEAEQDYQDISDELADELDYITRNGSLELLEGMTQFVTEASTQNGREIGEPFYPQETEMARKYLELRGYDLEDEFSEYDGEEFNSELELYSEIEATSEAIKNMYETDFNASMKMLEQEIF